MRAKTTKLEKIVAPVPAIDHIELMSMFFLTLI